VTMNQDFAFLESGAQARLLLVGMAWALNHHLRAPVAVPAQALVCTIYQ
jgi:hypothetical protein